MILQIVGALAFLVLLGSTTVIVGARHSVFPAKMLPIAFAVTAASWLAFLIAAIGAAIILLGFPRA
jgi:hypothetical protein